MDRVESRSKKNKILGKLWAKVKRTFTSKTKPELSSSHTANTESQPQVNRSEPQKYVALDAVPHSTNQSSAQSTEQQIPDHITQVPSQSQLQTASLASPTLRANLPLPASSGTTPAASGVLIEPEPDDVNSGEATTTTAMDLTPTPGSALASAETPQSDANVDEKDEATKRYERAQAIFKKYSMDFSEEDWDMYPKVRVERVSKAPRMRVRYTCHECKTTFGHDRTCVECAHHRCKKCVRYPPKRKKAKIEKPTTATQTATDQLDTGACHECQTSFSLGVAECTNCHHQICDRCLQETVIRSQQQLPLSAAPQSTSTPAG